jgi:hypothetical protein
LESIWGSHSFYKNQNWRFFIKGKNRPTLAYFLCVTTFWPLQYIRRLLLLIFKTFFFKITFKERGVCLLCPTLAWHTWRSAPSFLSRPHARCDIHLYPYLVQHTLRSACTLFFTKDATAQDACVCLLREWKCSYLEPSTVLITFGQLSLYLQVYSFMFSSLGWTST